MGFASIFIAIFICCVILGFIVDKWFEILSLLGLAVSVAIGMDYGWIAGILTFILTSMFAAWLSGPSPEAATQAFVSETGDYFLYVIGDGFCNKVGIAKDPNMRLKQLQTGHPNQLELLETYKLRSKADAFELERAVHRELAEMRARGEWFNASRAEIENAVARLTA